MTLKIGNTIPVATNFIRSNPAVPVYKGEEAIENLYAVIYHIEIGYNKDDLQTTKQYVIVDYKDYRLDETSKRDIMDLAMEYCKDKGIDKDENLEIKLLDDEVAEDFLEKIFNNMKLIRGLISKE